MDLTTSKGYVNSHVHIPATPPLEKGAKGGREEAKGKVHTRRGVPTAKRSDGNELWPLSSSIRHLVNSYTTK